MKNTELTIVPCTEEYVEECARISVEAYEIIHECYAELMTEEIHEGETGAKKRLRRSGSSSAVKMHMLLWSMARWLVLLPFALTATAPVKF